MRGALIRTHCGMNVPPCLALCGGGDEERELSRTGKPQRKKFPFNLQTPPDHQTKQEQLRS